jgi:hypothetical protein
MVVLIELGFSISWLPREHTKDYAVALLASLFRGVVLR